MTKVDKSKPTSKTDPSQKHVLDMKGSEQHHDLENQPGEEGDPDHLEPDVAGSDEVEELVEDALSDNKEDTTMAAALKKAVK